jgi:hypothetical protein
MKPQDEEFHAAPKTADRLHMSIGHPTEQIEDKIGQQKKKITRRLIIKC